MARAVRGGHFLFETGTGSGTIVFLEMLHALGEPLLVMNTERRIRFTNAAADAALSADDGLTIQGNILTGEDHDMNDRLMAAVASACVSPGETFSVLLKPRAGGRCGVLHLSLLGQTQEPAPQIPLILAKISLNDNPRAHDFDLLRQAFGLSQAESDIAMLIAAGMSPRHIAARRKSSEDTVRWHIKNIFSKTNTTRLTDLVLQLSAARSPFFGEARVTETGPPYAETPGNDRTPH